MSAFDEVWAVFEGLRNRLQELALTATTVDLTEEEQSFMLPSFELSNVSFGTMREDVRPPFAEIIIINITPNPRTMSLRQDFTINFRIVVTIPNTSGNASLMMTRVYCEIYDVLITSSSKMKLDASTDLTVIGPFTPVLADETRAVFEFDITAIRHRVT